jgi:hypothetical protein
LSKSGRGPRIKIWPPESRFIATAAKKSSF